VRWLSVSLSSLRQAVAAFASAINEAVAVGFVPTDSIDQAADKYSTAMEFLAWMEARNSEFSPMRQLRDEWQRKQERCCSCWDTSTPPEDVEPTLLQYCAHRHEAEVTGWGLRFDGVSIVIVEPADASAETSQVMDASAEASQVTGTSAEVSEADISLEEQEKAEALGKVPQDARSAADIREHPWSPVPMELERA
jgi:hypothetical protein